MNLSRLRRPVSRRAASPSDGERSGPTDVQRTCRLAAWLALAVVVFVTVSPIGLRPHDVMTVQGDRAVAFGLLAGLFVLSYPRHWLLVGLAVVAAAGGIEWLQELSPTRHARWTDAMVKAGGALCGVGLAGLANVLMERRRRR